MGSVTLRYISGEGDEVVTSLAEADAGQIVRGQPVRGFGSYAGMNHYPGWWWSSATASLIPYESLLERERLLSADFDRDVVAIASQPFGLSGQIQRTTRRHVPDFLLMGTDRTPTVVDVKPAKFTPRPEVAEVLEWTGHNVHERGWRYEVWTGLDPTVRDNLRFLAAGRRPELVDPDALALLREADVDGCRIGYAVKDIARSHRRDLRLVRAAAMAMLWNADNTAASVTDAAGRVATFTYAGGVLTRITDSAGRQINYGYTSGRLTSSADPDGKTTTYGYDSSGRLSWVKTARGVKVSLGYDADDRVTSVTRYTALAGGGSAQTTTFAYPSSTSTTQTNAAGKTWTYTRDAAGRVTKVTDPLGRSRAQSWTANSSIATATDAMGAGGVGGNVSTYSYDSANNPIQVALPTGAVSSAVYTTGGACGSSDAANPDLPKCITDDAGNKTAMSYDALGNLTAKTDTTAGATGGARLSTPVSAPLQRAAARIVTVSRGRCVRRRTRMATSPLTGMTATAI